MARGRRHGSLDQQREGGLYLVRLVLVRIGQAFDCASTELVM